MADEKNEIEAPDRPTDPGRTTWADGGLTDGDNEVGDLTTAGDVLRAETGQEHTLEEVRPEVRGSDSPPSS